MEREDLLKIIEGDIDHIDSVNMNDVALYEMRVAVKPRHVRKMLLNYLAGQTNANDLSKWASFICMRSEFGSPNYNDEEFIDYYEDMFSVIQALSTPEIDGEINMARVKLYLSELNKYPE